MQTLPAQEVKRRGLAAIEELLPLGPVHILKRNRPSCVVLSEAEYARLSARPANASSAWDVLLAAPGAGTGERAEVDRRIEEEREHWE